MSFVSWGLAKRIKVPVWFLHIKEIVSAPLHARPRSHWRERPVSPWQHGARAGAACLHVGCFGEAAPAALQFEQCSFGTFESSRAPNGCLIKASFRKQTQTLTSVGGRGALRQRFCEPNSPVLRCFSIPASHCIADIFPALLLSLFFSLSSHIFSGEKNPLEMTPSKRPPAPPTPSILFLPLR